MDAPKKGNFSRKKDGTTKVQKSEDEASFTLVSCQRKLHATRCNTNSAMTTYKAVLLGKLKEFNGFQKQVHSAIEDFLKHYSQITTHLKSRYHCFSIKWIVAKQRSVNLEDATFRNVSKMLQVKDLMDYKNQLQEIPEFDKYMTFSADKIHCWTACNLHPRCLCRYSDTCSMAFCIFLPGTSLYVLLPLVKV